MPPKKKPQPKTEAPELTYVPEGELPKLFLVQLASGGWRTKDGGSTESILMAGTFQHGIAVELALAGDRIHPLDRAVHEACRSANPMMLAAVAAFGAR